VEYPYGRKTGFLVYYIIVKREKSYRFLEEDALHGRNLIMASLSLQHIMKVYPNGYEAVKDFNLEIADKEFIIFVGPSGCGKSTTLRMIAGLEDISSGTFKIDDKVMNDVEPKDRDIAMVFQNYALYPHMTVYDNMAFGLKLRKVPKDEIDKMVREAARILDLEKLLDRKPKALSGGQRQRVAMGRAIVRNPKVFLMDEPLSNLDAKLRVQMRTEISKLHQRLGATIIYVTHDQTEAMTLGTRIVVMKDGIVQQVDSPQVLYNQPCNLFVAGFIGSPQMNFLDAKVIKEGGEIKLQVGTYKIRLPKAKAAKVESYIGKTVVMGIRPEDVYGDERFIAEHPDDIIDSVVTVYELLGAEVFLYTEVQGYKLNARVDASTGVRTGDTVRFALDIDKIHVFDKETEKTITN
jgi:multiple sugar transport system ATP-binding protein